jgi:hypothetical protein
LSTVISVIFTDVVGYRLKTAVNPFFRKMEPVVRFELNCLGIHILMCLTGKSRALFIVVALGLMDFHPA